VLVVHKDKTQSVKQAPGLFAPKAVAAE